MGRLFAASLLLAGLAWAQPVECPPHPTTRPPRGDAPVPTITRNRHVAPPPVPNPRWRQWWDYNRDHLVGFRHLLAVGPGKGRRAAADPVDGRRNEIREALRRLARDEDAPRGVRAAALLALGRAGEAEDALFLLDTLADRTQPLVVHESAALALGALPALRNAGIRARAREALTRLVRDRSSLRRPAWKNAVTAAGLRARDDGALVMALMGAPARTQADAAALLAAMGLTGSRLLVPELHRAVQHGEYGGRKLGDAARAHATVALGRIDEPASAALLTSLLGSRRAGVHTRRSAALALGRLLSDGVLAGVAAVEAKRALLVVLEDAEADTALRGFAALALADALEPAGIDVMRRAVRGRDVALRPYAALALGLAARNMPEEKVRPLQTYLHRIALAMRSVEHRQALETRMRYERPFPDAREGQTPNAYVKRTMAGPDDLGSAACLALGLMKATGSRRLLAERAGAAGLHSPGRAAAAQALGLIGEATPEVRRALLEAMRTGPAEMLEDAAVAMAMLRDEDVTAQLVRILGIERLRAGNTLVKTDVAGASDRLREAKRASLAALGRFGGGAAVDPLLEHLGADQHAILREEAAIGLGLLAGPRGPDLFYALDRGRNFLARERRRAFDPRPRPGDREGRESGSPRGDAARRADGPARLAREPGRRRLPY